MLLITGAGVDRTPGIDFPLANTLLADVTRYLDGPGKTVDEALRKMLPGLRLLTLPLQSGVLSPC
jgi:hypothetical protein